MKKIAYTLITGIAVGTLIGVLLAPDEGKETQRKIAKRGKKITDDLKCKFDELVDSVQDQIENIQDRLADMSKKKREFYNDVTDYKNKAKGTYSSLKEEVKDNFM
jgi:gas vesicle protein